MATTRQNRYGFVCRCCLLLVLLLPLLCTAKPGQPQGPLVLTEQQAEYNVYSSYTHAHVVHDPAGQWAIADFASGRRDYRELPRRPASTIEAMGGTYWLMLEVNNQHPKEKWRLNFQHGRTDLIEVLVLPQNGLERAVSDHGGSLPIHRGGMQTAPEEREIASLGYTFPIQLPRGETSVILIRVYSYLYEGGLYVYLEEADYNTRTSFTYHVLVLALLGLMVGMTAYNLFIFLVTRDIPYFWYSLVACTLTLSWASYYGLTWSILGWNDPQRYNIIYIQIAVLIFTLMFVRSFLDLPHAFKKLNYAVMGCFYYLLALALAALFFHPARIFLAFWLMLLFGTVVILVVSICCIVKGYRPARFLIGGQGLVAVGSFQTGLAIFGLVPYEDPVPHHFTAMCAGEMVLLSMALADRINQLRNEKRIAEEANRLKSSFLALMSHEIRTPLNGLLSMIKLLARSKLNQRQRGYVESMDYSGNALLSILNGLLDYSKIEAQNIELENIPFDPRLLVESLVMLMSARASEKGLILAARIDKQLPPQVVGDPNRLRQVLLNLIGNAVKFTNRGIINICVQEVERTEAEVAVRFEVEDSGIGIAPDDQTRVFDVFTQADASITRRFGGTGLGLSICKRLVEMMGGNLALKSRLGQGSNFHFTLKLPYGTVPLPVQTETKPGAAAQALAPLHILLVDDVELNRVAASGLLEHEGHEVTLASGARQALELIQQQHFDIVLMDIHMPDMDGVTATQHIRQLEDITKASLPVIALTANASLEQRREYLAAGINEVASKPLDVEELLGAIANLTHKPFQANDTALEAV